MECFLSSSLPSSQVLELLCNKAQPHRCSTGLMGSLSPSWRRPGLSGDRAGRNGQKWGASCHDNRWGLLIGQGTRGQARLFFFFFFFFTTTVMKIKIPAYEYAHPGTNQKPTERFGSFTVLPLPHLPFLHWPLISHCSYHRNPFPMRAIPQQLLIWFSLNPPKQCCICKMWNQFEGTKA